MCTINNDVYPAMTAFTDQYSLPNIFFLYWSVINYRTYKCKLRPHRGTSGDIVFKYIHKIISNTFIIVQ